MLFYIFFFIFFFTITFITIPFLIKFSVKNKFFALDFGRNSHYGFIPILGGVSFFISYTVLFFLLDYFPFINLSSNYFIVYLIFIIFIFNWFI